MNTIEGNLFISDSSGHKSCFGIVVGRFNEMITKKLLEGAVDCLTRHGVSPQNIDVAWVPGSFEIPLIAKKMAQTSRYDAILCLGAVIRGHTPHFDYVCNTVASGVASISLETGSPVIFGVLTTNTIEQALERAGSKSGNKGWDAGLAAIEMVNLVNHSHFSYSKEEK